MICRSLGIISFDEGRKIQEELIRKRAAREIEDTLITCEHYPTLSIGRRAKEDEWIALKDSTNISIVHADRGGGVTYHGPGQLVMYPVVSLKERIRGVRDFVESALKVISLALEVVGVGAISSLSPAGVWVENRKIASVGLRILDGISNHGFSVNIQNDLSIYSNFVACGLRNAQVTSVSVELRETIGVSEVEKVIVKKFVETFGSS